MGDTQKVGDLGSLPSAKQPHNYGKIHHFSWENPLFRLGHGFNGHGFNSYVTNYQRVFGISMDFRLE